MECVQVRRSLDTFVSGFGDADTSSEIPWISRKDKKEGRSLHEKGIFQILVYLIQVIYAVELSLFWRFICEIYNSLNSLLRPHSSVTCPSSSRDRPPYIEWLCQNTALYGTTSTKSLTTSSDDEIDEYEAYLAQKTLKQKPTNLFSWWINKAEEWPCLASLAFTVLSIPAMSTEVERVFIYQNASHRAEI